MIKSEIGKGVTIEGGLPVIMAETEKIIRSVKKILAKKLGEERGKEMFDLLLDTASKSDEEVAKLFEETKKKVFEDLKAILKGIMDYE